MTIPAFALPAALEATAPPEERGLRRDDVRLMIATGDGEIRHADTFASLPDHLRAGDLLVVNISATLPAALAARRADGEAVRVHVSTRVPGRGRRWRVVELRSPGGDDPLAPRIAETLALPGGARLVLTAPYRGSERLSVALWHGAVSPERLLRRHGAPIRYGYAPMDLPLERYQTVFARVPGSAEMPSAGRPFSPRVLAALGARGVAVAPIVLHCGVSSPERHEPPFPERYVVPAATARALGRTRRRGGRVIAVGTTVARALETVSRADRTVHAASGWTDLAITPGRGVRVLDGIITGWHEPEASHLQLLEALAGEALLARSYAAALAEGYLFHEFGDSHLILP
jgi:S-adenosylmethionine:tRNA ribosyltransferase-isomerase